MRRPSRRTLVLGAVGIALTFHVILAYALPWRVVLGAIAAYILIMLFAGVRNALTLAATLAFITIATAVAFKITGLDRAIYYRPHEQYSVWDHQHGFKRYKRNVDVTMEGVHGDLQSMTKRSISVPRDVHFRTDSRGFRNNRDFSGQRYLLVGDSFVGGVSMSQESILGEQLYRKYGLDCYSLGYPGAIQQYERYIESLPRAPGVKSDVLLFIFEGNDFPDTMPPLHSRFPRLRRFIREYLHMFQTTTLYRVSKSVRMRLENRSEIDNESLIDTMQTPEGEMVFYHEYVEVTLRTAAPKLPEFEAAMHRLRDRLAIVFFIPTKYRVYSTVLDPGKKLPDANWDYLHTMCERDSIRCVDLTRPLVERSAALLPQGQFTFRPDGTHWNENGIAVAAAVVDSLVQDGSSE